MNLTTLVSETDRQIRLLNRTQNVLQSERRQRIRTAQVQNAIFVRDMLVHLLRAKAAPVLR